MNQNKQENFGQYLRDLRELREMSVKAVEDKIHARYPLQDNPKNKSYYISASHLAKCERGESKPPNPLKLKALSEVYNEDYNFILYKAGYLERNPHKDLNQFSQSEVFEIYLDKVCHSNKTRVLSENEKRNVEKLIEELIQSLVDTQI